VVVVVPEHGDERDREAAAAVGQHGRLLGQPVGRQVAREEDHVDVARGLGEALRETLAVVLRRVEVADGRHTEPAHVRGLPARRFGLPDARVHPLVAYTPSESFPELVDTMKKGAAALRDAEVPFLLGGGLAAWAYGGPPTDHDVDFLLREADVERALEALADVGMRPERPPEGWLLKAWDGDVLVDLIFEPAGGPVGDEHFDRAVHLEVAALPLLVASIDDVLATKLLAMSEQDPDYRPVLEIARSLREQIDWDFVRERTAGSPFARAFFTLVEELGVVEAA
jgi:hypothetical protein